eukprot:TRINITY_DN4516_c0_g1_i1.p1 TRINITY_DN4516_c0_g1~~TRINITY_DN4516_c0_g1_i1.p1  ORF type:complete len:428 (-),score=118.89 TRINITY_DN4516_c0_g1_i1:76-1359(-)
MKLKSINKSNLITSLILFTTAIEAAVKTCSYDYQCGNIPYVYCIGGQDDCLYTLDGVSLSNGRIYYGEVCRGPDDPYAVYGQKINTTLKYVTLSTGKITSFYSEQRSRRGNIGGVYGIVGKNLYVNRYRRYTGLDSLNLDSLSEEDVFLKFYGSVAFTNENTYACIYNRSSSPDDYRSYYNINKYNGIVSAQNQPTPQVLYTSLAGQCGASFVSGTNIYFALSAYTEDQYEKTSVYRGTTQCNSCQLPAPLFVVNGSVYGFALNPSDSSKLYFGTDFGVFSWDKSTNKITNLTNDPVNGQIAFYQGSIYYNTGASIRSVSVTTKKVKEVNNKKIGECRCAPGFTGNNCNICNGQVQWENNAPSCVATNADGVPVTCTQDYQCGNIPYTFCDGASCACQTNFTGPKCDKCTGQITFNSDGIPSCSLSS